MLFVTACSKMDQIRWITLDPGHFHAALVQKTMYPEINPEVHVYAPKSADLNLHLERIENFNQRKDQPTAWKTIVYDQNDFYQKFLEEKPGSVVSITGPTDNAYSLKIKKCYFEGAGPNYVSSNGGSIYISNPTTDVFIENSTFRKFYTSDKGGAICIDKAKSFKGVNLTVAGNECASDNDGVNSAGIQIISVNGANLLQNSIVVGNSMPEASKNTNLISGSSINTQNCLIDNYDSVGQLSIKGFAFDATKNVYKYENGSMPVKTGDASFLSEDLDQIGNVRKKSEVMAVDIGAWHSNHSTKGGGVLSIGALEVSNTSIKVYQDNAGNVVVEAPETNEVTATVYSIVGSKILEVQIVNEIGVIKTDVLNSGVYVLELNADGNKIAKQFIIE